MLKQLARRAAQLMTIAVAATAIAGGARAADLKSDFPVAHHPMYLPPAWTGLYYGANLGYGAGHFRSKEDEFNMHSKGVVGGLHAGYNWQFRNFVLGAEGDFNWASVNGDKVIDGETLSGHMHNFSSVRGRVGLAFDRVLFFGTLGYGWSDVKLSLNDGISTISRSHTHSGLVYGTGAEYKLSPSLSLRAEALRYDMSGDWQRDDGSRFKLRTPATEVRAGLTLHFNSFR